MTKSELISLIAGKQSHLQQKDVELAINNIIDQLTNAMSQGLRIEIRGFGGFSLRKRKACLGRNPKTGERVRLPERYSLYFKPGLDLRDRVNDSKDDNPVIKDV